jgi:uncharacterized protein with GYD domain
MGYSGRHVEVVTHVRDLSLLEPFALHRAPAQAKDPLGDPVRVLEPSITCEPDLGSQHPALVSCGSGGGRIASNERAMQDPKCPLVEAMVAMSKYAVFFTLKGEAIARAMEQPSDRVLVVSKAVESAGGKLEAYYLMFGQYDGFVIVELPDSRAAAATSLAVSSTGAFEHLETHELIEAEDLNPLLEQAKDITAQLPGT